MPQEMMFLIFVYMVGSFITFLIERFAPSAGAQRLTRNSDEPYDTSYIDSAMFLSMNDE